MALSARSLSVLHLSYSQNGGAGKIASLLATQMKVLGLDSKLITDTDGGIRDEIFTHPTRVFRALADFYVVRRSRRTPLFSLFRNGTSRSLLQHKIEPTRILHLHWTPGLVSLQRIRDFNYAGAPIVWTLHDMWPITGGCHHALECTKFESDCIQCPQSRKLFQHSVAGQFAMKKHLFEDCKNLTFVAPSKWMAELAVKSKLTTGRQVHVIPNPVNTNVFKKKYLDDASKQSGEEFVVGIIATDLSDPIKNVVVAKEIFRKLASSTLKPVRLVTVGRNPPAALVENGITNLQSIERTEEIVDFYNSLDVIICTSLIETFPTILLEAGACGVPAVVFNIGGMADIVIDGVTGYVVGGKEDAVSKLENLLNDKDLRTTLSRQARKYVEDNYSLEIILEKYFELYQEIMKSYPDLRENQ